MAEEEDSIVAEAAARRERLKALRTAQELLNTPDDQDPEDLLHSTHEPPAALEQNGDQADEQEQDSNVSMKFRNYLPQDKKLQEGKLAPPVVPKFEEPLATEPVQDEKKEDPFLNIAPKKPNWDLKRDVQKKLDKLEKRSLKAMYKLLAEEEKRRRLADEGEGEGEGEGGFKVVVEG